MCIYMFIYTGNPRLARCDGGVQVEHNLFYYFTNLYEYKITRE